MDDSLAVADIVSVGMYLQTLIWLLAEAGLGSIPQASWAGYPELVKEELGLPKERTVLCALATGYADEKSSLNYVDIPKSLWQENIEIKD
jgi:nitroreductase